MINFFGKMAPAKRRILLAVIGIILAVVVVLGVYVLAVMKIKTVGVKLRPSRDFPVRQLKEYYLQNDPEWTDLMIGDSSYTMGGSGCLLSSVASSLEEMGEDITPQELNESLTTVKGYEGGAFLLWYKLNEVIPTIDYKYKRVFGRGTIEKDLENGRIPIIKVKYKGGGVDHWLLVLGSENGEFMVSDPLNQQKEPIPLSQHGGRVYAYRVLVPAKNI